MNDTAHRKNGDRCRRAAINGGRVCTHHGGRAPAVKAKARQRIEEAAARMARELLGIATDKNAPESVRLTAIKDALDRAGLSAKTAVSVAISPTPWEEAFDDIVGGSRAESRRGIPEDELDDDVGRADGLADLLADKIDIPVPRIKSWLANPAPKLATVIAGMCAGAGGLRLGRTGVGHIGSLIGDGLYRGCEPWAIRTGNRRGPQSPAGPS